MISPTASRCLLLSSAAAVLLAPLDRVAAQAFQGDHLVVAGAATRTMTTPTTETISVESPSAILNWAPADIVGMGPVDFLPAGNVATFQNGPNNPDFIVLNRILPQNPARPVALNGGVLSRLQQPGGTATGGTVAFYTPGGLIVGPTALFDIGNLLLTTIDPALDAQGNFFVANSYALSGPVNPASAVAIQAGASIAATQKGSYVAVAAPQVRQNGNVRVDGSVAYVAAESVSLAINNGLFDIQVKLGSSSAPATLIHQGATGGPASAGPGDNQTIYMVAIPKNTAISLLLRGNVGYDAPAAGAVAENGAIILSAGRNVNQVFTQTNQPNAVAANIDIRAARATSDLSGIATEDAIATAFAGQPLVFDQDVTLVAPEANLGSDGGPLTVRGSATLTTGRHDDFNLNAGQGGNANLFSRAGGTVTVDGDTRVSASTRSVPGTDATGGDAIVSADGGAIFLGGALRVEADADQGFDPNVDPGDSLGGTAAITAAAGGTVNVAGPVAAGAAGRGGIGFGAGDGTPGTGTGGTAVVRSNGANSAVTLGGTLLLDSSGLGGSANAGATSGGAGGDARLEASGGGRIAVAGAAELRATGLGGTGVAQGAPLPDMSGGSGTGGTARILVNAGNVQLDALVAGAVGTGGAATGTGQSEGTGTGGLVDVSSTNGALVVRDALYQALGVGIVDPASVGANGNVRVTAVGNPIAGERMQADSGGDAILAGIALTARILATADGLLRVLGPVAAPSMALVSRDVDIPAGGSVGGAGTTDLLFEVRNPTQQTLIGGAAAGPGYTLDAAELGRARSDAINVFAPKLGTAADVLVDDFDLQAGAAANPFSFRLDSDGTVRVVGEVRLLAADAADSLTLRADERLQVIAPGGGLYLLDAAGNPAGLLQVLSANVAIADAALADQLAADPVFAGRDAALLANQGPPNPLGFVRAGGAAFTVGTTLFVQNSGTPDDLAGITVGAGGLTIAPAGQQPAVVVGFGRRLNPDGSFTTGDAFFGTVVFDRSKGGFTDGSELNLCKINGGACPRRRPVPAPTASDFILGPLNMIEQQADPSDLIDAGPLTAEPLIEEPVTSGGDGFGAGGEDEDEEDE